MRLGINTFLFASPFSNNDAALFRQFRHWGFDTVEIAIEDPLYIDPVLIKRALEESGLVCGSVAATMGQGRDLRGSMEEQVAAAEYIKSLISIMPELGSQTLIGPIYSSVGRAEATKEEIYEKQWQTVVSHLKDIAAYAVKQNVKIAVEPLNRYETDFINTCDQVLRLIDDVNNDALMLMLDTFHTNIEEKDTAQAILKAGNKLLHLHACGCDRGTPGNDHIQWPAIFAALEEIGFSGDIVIESFTKDVKAIAKAASIWRKIEPERDQIAIKGAKFLRSHFLNKR